jgi:hypothetical protein
MRLRSTKKDRALADPITCLTPLLVTVSPNGPAGSGDFAGVAVLVVGGAGAAALPLEARTQPLPQARQPLAFASRRCRR